LFLLLLVHCMAISDDFIVYYVIAISTK